MDPGNLFGSLFRIVFRIVFRGNRIRGKIDSDRQQIQRVGHLLPIDEHRKTLATLVPFAGPIPKDRDFSAS